ENEVVHQSAINGMVGIHGVLFDPFAKRMLVMGGWQAKREGDAAPAVGVMAIQNGKESLLQARIGDYLAGSPAVALAKNEAGYRPLVVPLTASNEVAVLDADSGGLRSRVSVGVAPFGSVVSRDGRFAYVSNWGGRQPRSGDRTLTSGSGPGDWQSPLAKADPVVVDEKGAAASGTVTRIDLVTGRMTHDIETGLHPNGLAWDEKVGRLYVANNNSDTVSVVDTQTQRVLATIALKPWGLTGLGVAPSAIALSPDGQNIFVACSGLNAIAVIDPVRNSVRGYIPTAWYPTSVQVSADAKSLLVGSAFGYGYPVGQSKKRKPNFDFRGAASLIPIPDEDQLASYTAAVRENNRLPMPELNPRSKKAKAIPVPLRAGEPSSIKHVVYIIKENKTYDSYFGDLTEGNGDPGLLLYGDKIIPNHRKLAREFVLLDNLYSNGRNSADGHQWLTQAIATGYVWWPGYAGRSKPFTGNDPLAVSSAGAIWDSAARKGHEIAVFGEYIPDRPRFREAERRQNLLDWMNGKPLDGEPKTHARNPALDRHVIHNYPVWDLRYPDVVRADLFLKQLGVWESRSRMPALSIVQLPGDHGKGSDPGVSTMNAFV
ncbi:MAG: hypothetical protein H7039_16540, partial [Bryobacteraceae bacterium]|nr:hypothetical protein [Bryobacteraceae bacterium]